MTVFALSHGTPKIIRTFPGLPFVKLGVFNGFPKLIRLWFIQYHLAIPMI